MNQSNHNREPLITVIMGAFNAEKYLRESIDSVINQSYQNIELIIINDASNDKTASILTSYSDSRIKIINNKINIGLTKSLNIGLRNSLGEFIARQDADDISMPDRLEKQLNFLMDNQHCSIVGSQCILIDEASREIPFPTPLKPLSMGGIKRYVAIDNPFLHSSVLFRKKVVTNLGGYNESFRTSQDFELWSRLLRKNIGANMPNKLIKFRIHEGSVSSGLYQQIQEKSRALLISKINNIMLGNVNTFMQNISMTQQWLLCNEALFNSGNYNINKKSFNLYKKGLNILKKERHGEFFTKQDNSDIGRLISSKYILIGKKLIYRRFFFHALIAYLEAVKSSPRFFWKYVMWIFFHSYKFKRRTGIK